MTRRMASRGRLLRLVGAFGVVTFLALAPRGGADAAKQLGFQSSASGIGVRVTLTIPNGPINSNLVDSGGPTAQAALNSFGTGSAYAAFPDAGPFLNDLPGLLTGLFPVPVAIPGYPLSVSADANTPSSSVGAGAYEISAEKSNDEATATASSGANVAANAAYVHSDASVEVAGSGAVTSTAVSSVEGMTVGPLSIGKIQSTVTRTLGTDGIIETKANTEVSGVKLGTLPIGIDQDGLNAAGTKIPLPIGDAANTVLDSLGMKLTVLPSVTKGDTVVSGALQISGVLPGDLGTGPTTYTIVLAQATSTVVKAAPAAPPTTPSTPDPTTSAGGPGGGMPQVKVPDAPVGAGLAVPTIGTGKVPKATNPGPAPTTTAPANADDTISLAAQLAGLHGAFGIANLYLIVAGTAVAAFATESLVRLLGVRRPWTSMRG